MPGFRKILLHPPPSLTHRSMVWYGKGMRKSKHFYFSTLSYFIQDGNFSRPCQFCHFRNFCQGANFGCCTIFVSHCKWYLSHIENNICLAAQIIFVSHCKQYLCPTVSTLHVEFVPHSPRLPAKLPVMT